MNLTYRTTTEGKSLRTVHIIVIELESMTTTIGKEVLQFAKKRGINRDNYRLLKQCVRNNESLSISGGK